VWGKCYGAKTIFSFFFGLTSDQAVLGGVASALNWIEKSKIIRI
jgi:hypothetical protein